MSGGAEGQSVISRGIIPKNFLHHSSLDGDVAYNITEPQCHFWSTEVKVEDFRDGPRVPE
jgi:hypothetical protein